VGGEAKIYKLSKRLARGPAGFTCKCGSVEFIYTPKRMNYSGTVFTRPEHRCAGCSLLYLFIPVF
jgi:hypothetical protein